MKKITEHIKYLLIISLFPIVTLADWLPLRVSVDKIIIGDLNSSLNAKGQATHVKGLDLVSLLDGYILQDKINRINKFIEPDGSLLLENLARVGILSEYNEKELSLILKIPLEIRIVKDFPVSISIKKAGLALYNKNYSGYLNVRGLVGYSDSSTPATYSYLKNPSSGQLELIQNLNYFTFETTANYKEFDETPIQRQDTSLVHDFEDEQLRLRLGDFQTGVQGFQTSMQAGGIQIQKQFGIYPKKNSINRRSTNIQVKNNSQMEVFVNNNLILRIRVNAGPYNLKELPLLYGRNKVKIVLLDDFGAKEEFEVDLLFDDQILAKGVSDFSYQVGNPSYFLGSEKKYFQNSLSSFYHKYGITDETTLFLNYQNYLSANLFGLGAGIISNFGTNFIDVANYSDSNVRSENAVLWRYNTPEINFTYFNQFRFSTNVEFKSLGFNSLSTVPSAPANYSEKYDLLFQKQLTNSSSMSLGATKLIGQNLGADEFTRRFTYQNRFIKNWRFDLSYSWSDRQKDFDQILFSLNWQEPAGRTQAAFAHDTGSKSSSVRVNKVNQVGYNELYLNMYADKQRIRTALFDSQNVDLSANYYAAKYETRAQIVGQSAGADFNTNGQLGFGSAFAWTADGVSFSRPITDSFAIVEAQNIARGQYLTIPKGLVRDSIKLENNDTFVFSNLASYIELPIKLDSTNLGLSSHLDREAYLITTKYRSGLFVPLKVTKSLVVMGKLISSKLEHVKYAHGKILTSDGQVFSDNFFTDESGNFVLDGLSYGKYQIELSDSSFKKISFELVDSSNNASGTTDLDSEASEFELGTIRIEKETGR